MLCVGGNPGCHGSNALPIELLPSGALWIRLRVMSKNPHDIRAMRPLAIFSPCRRYRYVLWREWDMFDPSYAMFIGLNPSTADETLDDPTIRRCVRFSKEWGYGALCMTNAFAFRATNPEVMKQAADPVGIDNGTWLKVISIQAAVVVAAWGVHGAYLDQDKEVMRILPALMCLGTTKEGYPKHPLYLRADTKPKPL